MSMVDDVLQGFSRGTYVRDFKHANKIFVSDAYALAPKHAYLFHVAFDINQTLSRMPSTEIIKMGMLVKNASLPKYTIDTKTLNAYNRPNIVQNKLKYNDVTIAFHDDSADVIRDFWYDYMSHYYRDTDYSESFYKQNTKYNLQQSEHWGYLPAKYNNRGSEQRILDSIRIYSLHQKRFTEYVLINPMITSFNHGQHDYSQTNGTMEHTMTVTYETVIYNYGTVKVGENPKNFATLVYDKTPSPLSPAGGGTSSILGPGGLLDSASGIGENLSSGGVLGALGAVNTAAKTYNNFKGKNILGIAGAELKNIGLGILQGDTNVLNRLALPKAGSGNGTNSLVQNGNDLLTYDNSGPQTPTGATPNQPLAGLSGIGAQFNQVRDFAQNAVSSLNTAAASVIQSNSELIANAQLPSNPLPPGIDI